MAAEGEDIAVVELPFTDALELVRTGGIADAKTIMLLQWAALHGPFADRPADGGPVGGGLVGERAPVSRR